ncbi:hypothetical protein X956_04135 [Trueperella pyogenes TP8]|uniref:hypothetical protein n=1 Tax=Trueperella pyogenes TaxID=1661 RepID=UPI00057F5A13|nr:hypothetical protein [Trueperella pyogenes]AJC70526.1 hypothetical protein X956_04135 [Trueperella pyogenes TP8]
MVIPDGVLDAAFATVIVAVIGLVGLVVGHWVQYKLGKQKAQMDVLMGMVNELQEEWEKATAREERAVERMDRQDNKISELRKELGQARDEAAQANIKAEKARVEAEKVRREKSDLEEYVSVLVEHINAHRPPPPPEWHRRIETN